MARLKLVCIAVVSMVLASAAVDAAISCVQVMANMSPCVGYLTGSGGPMPPGCCTGINNVNNAARTTPDRQATCRCLKTVASNFKSLNYGLVASIPGKCGISIPYKLSPNTDCNKVE